VERLIALHVLRKRVTCERCRMSGSGNECGRASQDGVDAHFSSETQWQENCLLFIYLFGLRSCAQYIFY
jgi:hypothetical protein